jgi:AcrR family transcriptional regulator
MPVPKGTTLDPERTRTSILDTATALFYERGLDGVGVAELCAAVGVSKETLYRHFGSKDGLVDAVLAARSDRVSAWLTEASLAAGSDPFRRVAAIFDALGGWYVEPTFRGCAIINAATQRHGDPARTIAERHLSRHLALLTDIARDVNSAEAPVLGQQLLMLLEGATVLADHSGGAGQRAAELAKRAALSLLRAAGSARRTTDTTTGA